MSAQIFMTAVASSVPFDSSTDGFTATDVQSAVEEAKATARGQATRYCVSFTQTGGTTAGSYVRFCGGTTSNLTPYVVPETGKIVAMSVSVSAANAGIVVFSIMRSGASISSITLPAGATVGFTNGLTIVVAPGDGLSIMCASGSSNSLAVNFLIATS